MIRNLFKKRRNVLIGIVILAAIFIGWRIFGGNKNKQTYQTADVTPGSIISTISESGNVSAAGQVNVSSPTDGIIEALYVKNGNTVSAGNNLFKVKSTATPEEQAQAYASYLSAQNTLNSAQAKLNSLQSTLFKTNQTFLNGKGNTPNPDTSDPTYIQQNDDWLQAEADYKNQQGVIAQAQAALNSAAFAYQETQDSIVTAPISGTIANLSVSTGSNVSASSGNANSTSTNATTASNSNSLPVLVIGNFSDLEIKVQASEVDIPNIHSGQKATITLDAFPGKTYVGTVKSVDNIGTNSSGVVTYNVYISFVAPPANIKPGMSASAIIQTARRDNVLTVPTSAIQTVNGQSYVRVLKNGQITQAPVEVGIASDSDTEITSGLSVGDTVVTSILTTTSGSGQSSSPFGGNRGFGGGGGGANVRIFRGG